ncbi:MAG: response regulator transcription factor [Candidatus Nanopelagicales bacterium]
MTSVTTNTGPVILVVEDDRALNEAITARLRANDYQVMQAWDGLVAVELAAARPPALIVLDLMLPGLDGLEVCRRVQAARPVPVLMCTARHDETERVLGLSVGADDYLTKPFSMRELVARVAALLRRVERAADLAAQATPLLRLGGLVVDPGTRQVTVHGAPVHFTRTEFDLLTLLVTRAPQVLSREDLMLEVWNWADAGGTRTLDSHIRSLRRKLGAEAIRTVHGVGYGFGEVAA